MTSRSGSYAGRRAVTCLLAAGLCAPGSAVAGQTDSAPPRPAVGPARPFTPPPRAERTLANGLQVIVVRYPTVPKVSVTLTIKTGLAADPSGLPGLAALTADGIQEGTSRRSSRQVREDAFKMGGSLSATAVQDSTAISIRGLAEFLPGMLDLLGDVAVNPTFPDEEIAIIKANLLETLQRQKGSPQFVANREFRRTLFGAHPYGRVTTTAEALATLDRAKLVEFHGVHYRPNNAFLLIVGDVTPEAAFTAADGAFGGWSRQATPPVTYASIGGPTGRSILFVQRPGSIQTSISLGNLAARRSDPAWYEFVVANTIYGGAFNSRIVRNIREDKGYTYSPFSQFAAFKDAGFYRFAADVRSAVTGSTLKEVYGEIEKLRADGAAGDELEGAKQYLRGVFVIQSGTQAGLSNVLNTVYGFDLPRDYLETYQARITAVGPDQLRAAATRLLGAERSVVVLVGDYTQVKDQLVGYGDITFVDLDGRRLDGPPTP